MMKNFATWLADEMHDTLPEGEVPMSWFSERGLPAIVHCTCCEMTMALPSAMISEEGEIFCTSCADDFEFDYDDCDYEMGFDPYEGYYTDDC